MSKISIKDLLEAGVHLGHPTKRWNPRMKPYIHCARNGIYILDLTKTMQALSRACQALHEISSNGGRILFVGTKRQSQDIIREAAATTKQYYMCERWLGGTLTNSQTIGKSITRMRNLASMFESGEIEERTKKEQANFRREHEKLHKNLSGISDLRGMPSALVVVDVDREAIAVREANRLGIPVFGLVDTNSNPDSIDFVIPANDDALRSIKVILDTLTGAIAAGQQIHSKRAAEEKATREKQQQAQAEAKAAAAKSKTAAVAEDADTEEEAVDLEL